MRRVLSALLALSGLGALLVSWPGGDRAAAVGVVLVVGVGVLLVLGRGALALVGLGVLGLSTMFLEGSLSTWQALVFPVLALFVVEAALGVGGDPHGAWLRSGLLVGVFMGVGVLAWFWRPVRAGLVGEEGVLVAVLLVGSVVLGLVLWLTVERESSLVGDRAGSSR